MTAFSDHHVKSITLSKIPIDIVSCPVCRDIPKQEKIFQCKNGHVVCETCSRQLTTIPVCPTCRDVLLEDIRNRVLESLLDFMETKCPFSEQGCSVVMARNDLTLHPKECLYRTVPICQILGFSDCDYATFNPDDTIDHLIKVHGVSCAADDDDASLAFDFTYPCESAEPSGVLVLKLLSSDITTATTTPPLNHQRLPFLVVLKQDEKCSGLLALSLSIGHSPKESTEFVRALYCFESAHVQDDNIPKCNATWPVLWYKDLVITDNEDSASSVWDNAYHISAQTLKTIQGQDENIKFSACIKALRGAERDP